MLEYCYSKKFLLGTLVFVNCNFELLIMTFKWGNCSKMFFLMQKQKGEKKQTNGLIKIFVRNSSLY